MPRDRHALGAPPTLPHVRSRRLLRQFAGEARDEALQPDAAPAHPELRARRGLGLVLRGPALHRAGASRIVSTATTVATAWPRLPLNEWQATYATVQLWTQIVGKTRLRLAPMQNHWWHCTLYVTSRGLGTSPIPSGDRTFEIEFDFLDHQLVVRASDGETRTLPLVPRAVADFYREYLALLRSLGVEVRIYPVPNEVTDAIPFAEDRVHASYDREAAQRC